MLSSLDRKLRKHASSIFFAGVSAVDPSLAVQRALRCESGKLVFANHSYSLSDVRQVYVMGAGKAAASMAQGVERVFANLAAENARSRSQPSGSLPLSGLVTTKDGHSLVLEHVRVVEAGHPLPDGRGEAAARHILQIAEKAGVRDLIICLISGGGSALLPLPASGLTLEDERAASELLLASGASIDEINIVRKHLSAIKGGQLARAAFPAMLLTLVLSDVIGDSLEIIASGPTVADSSTFSEARAVMMMSGVWSKVPQAVRLHLERGCAGETAETPKPGDPVFANVVTEIVGSNATALEAAERRARHLGYHTLILSSRVQGEARDVGRFYAALAHEVVHRDRPLETPACILAGGETTVTLVGATGNGGRNQEMALSAAIDIDGIPGCVFLAAGTDGTDGPTDAAGAFADGKSIARGKTSGLLHPAAFLHDHDSHTFFKTLDDLFITGPTRTNVMDLHILLVANKA